MIIISQVPQKIKRFFKPAKNQVSEHVFGYFWSMFLVLCLGHVSTIDRLVKRLRNSSRRTDRG
ncbi:MAG: hypothetical protein JXB18_01465 [Sedimentisphaerales bacterium]|nr:hypothetical protein [Sedimentisphaerales bacterium]